MTVKLTIGYPFDRLFHVNREYTAFMPLRFQRPEIPGVIFICLHDGEIKCRMLFI